MTQLFSRVYLSLVSLLVIVTLDFTHCSSSNAAPGEVTCDFDGSGEVDGFDLVQWQGDYGLNGFSDGDEDGDSDGRDFLCWQRHYGEGTLIAADSAQLVDYKYSDNYDAHFLLLADWQANYGAARSLSAAYTMPEPGSLTILAVLILFPAAGRLGKSGSTRY